MHTRPADDNYMYNGSLAVTDGGRLCQRWEDGWDDEFHYFEIDGTKEAAENFCRNVGYDSAWCYTTDPGVHCQVMHRSF